ncbi:MAG: DNA replication and repair protein RecF [Candidatus Firestonebacteria bacterium]
MYLSSLQVKNFKNLNSLSLPELERVNIITGRNGAGKTNTLQAIYFLSTLSVSFKSYLQAIRFGESFFSVGGELVSGGLKKPVEASFGGNKDLKLKINGNSVAKKSDYIGECRVVNFGFEDIDIVKGSPAERRRSLNILISQASRGYLKALQRYTAVLANKNKMLADAREGQIDRTLLAAFNEQLVREGSGVIAVRKKAVEFLLPVFRETYKKISAGREEVELLYKCSFETEKGIESSFREKLETLEKAEISRRTSLVGPHRDDLLFLINGREGKYFSSDGQQRSMVFSLRLAEYEYIKRETSDEPLILIDDVFYELDAERKDGVLSFFKEMPQIFIVSLADDFALGNRFAKAKHIRIKDGMLENGV